MMVMKIVMMHDNNDDEGKTIVMKTVMITVMMHVR